MFQFHKELEQLEQQHLFRALIPFDSGPGAISRKDGKTLLLFCTNNYLGLANHPKLKAAAISAIQEWGVGAGASRLISGHLRLNDRLESGLARFKSTEAALVFSSGYMTNVGAIGTIVQKEDLILADRLNHASLFAGCRLSGGRFRVYAHKDMTQLRRLLENRKTGQEVLIVTDGIFSMDGDIAPLSEILALAEEYDASIYLDDAHATGVLGAHGGGTCDHFNLSNPRIIQMGTFSKALGGFGGFIAGRRTLREYLINKAPSFIYTTALPPSILATALAALDLIETEGSLREGLWKNRGYFCRKVTQLGFDTLKSETPIVPLHIGSSEKAVDFSKRLFEDGIYIPPIRPPTVPEGTSRLRVTLTSAHTESQIDFLLSRLEKIGKDLRVI
jgi:8-amino-7-oxononanoate synthase